MIFVFDTKYAVEILPLQFLHPCLGIADAGSPRHVVSFLPQFVVVLEMEANDPPFQFLKAIQWVKPGFLPMTDVRTRADQWSAVFDRVQHGVGIPINRMTLGMLVN